MPDTTFVVLTRHTETDWNTEDRYSGQSDKPTLTGNGLRQAYLLARALNGYPILRVICSDLRRARDTALILASPHGLVPIVDPRLREVGLGEMDGLRKSEARARYTKQCFSTRSPSFDFSELGGESRAMVIARHKAVFEQYVQRSKGVSLVVGHGTSLRTFLESLGQQAVLHQGGFLAIPY